jgi:hypothetical protein
LKQKTDAVYANSKVTWDSLVINSRKYSKLFLSYPKTITQTDAETIYVFTTPAANTNITETDASTVAAYTGIAIDHGAQTITVTSNKTWAELYDYAQWNLTQIANMVYDDWLTTVDGVNYTSDYEIIADGADISAIGKTITGTVTVSSGGFFEDSSGAKWEDSGTIYYAKHVYRNIKAVTGGANKQYAVIAAFDASGNDRTYSTARVNGGLVTDASGNAEGYYVWKYDSTTLTLTEYTGLYGYIWSTVPIDANGTSIGSSGAYSTNRLTTDPYVTLSRAAALALSEIGRASCRERVYSEV